MLCIALFFFLQIKQSPIVLHYLDIEYRSTQKSVFVEGEGILSVPIYIKIIINFTLSELFYALNSSMRVYYFPFRW